MMNSTPSLKISSDGNGYTPMGVKDLVRRLREKNERVKELEIEDRATARVQEKKLSANERELIRILEEKRQEQIKRDLEKHRKQKQKDFWHHDVIKQKDIFKKDGNIVMKQKNIFNNQKRLFGR